MGIHADSQSDDSVLLERYATGRSQEAFAQVVRRYAGVVYASARRQVRDAHLVEDVTQAVFITLAKKAHAVPPGVVLSGWLLTATRYAASNARVIRSRRRRHETRAAEMARTVVEHDTRGADWEGIEGALDKALAELPPVYRDAVALRYFEGRSLAQVAEALRVTEDAGKQRVSRAVRRLRAALMSRGVAVPAAALGANITAHAVEAAPPALLKATLAAAGQTTTASTILKSLLYSRRGRRMTAAAAVLVVAAGLVARAVRKPPARPGAGGIVYRVPGTDKVLVDKDRSYQRIP